MFLFISLFFNSNKTCYYCIVKHFINLNTIIMKKLLLSFILLIITTSTFAQLNTNANHIKKNLPDIYTEIKSFAAEDWAGDHTMMVHVINKQSDAFVWVINNFERLRNDETLVLILANALTEWANPNWMNNPDGSLAYMAKGADWSMVKYIIEKEEKAAASY